MKYLERFLRYIFWVVITAVVAWLVKKFFTGTVRKNAGNARSAQQSGAELPKAKMLFRDPVCGSYVAEDISQTLSSGQDSENLHFCSRDCMETYRREHATENSGNGRVAAGA